jgi:hypothetical protein
MRNKHHIPLISAYSVIKECCRIKAAIACLFNSRFKERVKIIYFVVVSIPTNKNR